MVCLDLLVLLVLMDKPPDLQPQLILQIHVMQGGLVMEMGDVVDVADMVVVVERAEKAGMVGLVVLVEKVG